MLNSVPNSPLRITNSPDVFRPINDWQTLAWRDKSFILLATGSAGGGKSKLAAEKLHAFCMKYPGATCMMLRKTRESTTNSIVAFMKGSVIGKGLGNYVHHRSSDGLFQYDNGSVMLYGGMRDEEQRERIRSIGSKGGIDMMWLEEASQFVESDFNEVLARMRGDVAGWGQIILTTNPDSPSHWIYQRLMQGGEATVYKSRAQDNPVNPSRYLKILNSLTGIQRKRLVDGLWVLAEGAVYDDFDPTIHVIDVLPELSTFKSIFASVDWGFTNPGTIQVWGKDYDDRLILIHEVYRTQQMVESFWVGKAKELKQKFKIETFVCDPSSPAYIQAFQLADLDARPADNDIRSGVDLVKEQLRLAEDGKPRLMIYRGCLDEIDVSLEESKRPTGILDEFPLYIWPTNKASQPIKEVPLKKNDHAMDTMRYAVKHARKGIGVGFI